nr:pentapeptide repeat-containing protein [Pedobacter panaciterrae]
MLNTKIIGNKIADARKKINISQARLAERLFISSQAVGKWERGESMPDITTFSRLAEILGVDLNYFSESFQCEVAEAATVESPSGKQDKKPVWDMSLGNWVDADFSGLKNLNKKFSSSNIQRSKFIGSDMSGLLLKSNHIDSCDFSGSDISNSHIQTSHLTNNIFNDCSLKETEFSKSHIKGCDLSGADFTGVLFKSCAFQENKIANANWNRTSFIDTNIADIVFDGILEDCYFENCVFNWVKFQNSTLIDTFFKNNTFKRNRMRFVDCQTDRITYELLKSGKADLTGITLLAT